MFTTHTPVPAGIDRFPRDLIAQYFGGDNACAGVPVDRILALGSEDYEGGDPAMFNMAVMGFRLAQRANGVSQLHGVVSRGMFGGLWPQFDADERPITSITNGVHAPTWVAREIFDLARTPRRPARPRPGRRPARTWSSTWSTRSPARRSGTPSGCSASGSSTTPARGCEKSWQQRGAAPAELKWIDKCARRRTS